jgi:hypothetical protein
VPASLFVQITAPADGAILTSAGETAFRAIAYDPAVGTNDAQGISQVLFTILDPNGVVIHTRTENVAAYCAFGGDAPCNTAPLGQWNGWAVGTYTVIAEARSSLGKPAVFTSATFTKQ